MKSFGYQKIKELDSSFYNYLKSATENMFEYENLLIGLQDLNKNHKTKRIVFINSTCSKKGFVCINCENHEINNILKSLEEILKLHNFRLESSKQIIKEIKNT